MPLRRPAQAAPFARSNSTSYNAARPTIAEWPTPGVPRADALFSHSLIPLAACVRNPVSTKPGQAQELGCSPIRARCFVRSFPCCFRFSPYQAF
jgi:hypothetical protein